jgi:hypothetical protein
MTTMPVTERHHRQDFHVQVPLLAGDDIIRIGQIADLRPAGAR